MSQKIYLSWQEEDASFLIGEMFMGSMPEGRCRGFDTFVSTNSMELVLTHDILETGFQYTLKDPEGNPDQSVPCGLVRTKQGQMVVESGNLNPVTIPPNTSGNDRIDLIVCEHTYYSTPGGVGATYILIEGTPSSSPVAPALTNPNVQVVVGQLYVPDGTTGLDNPGVTWTPTERPEFNGLTLQQDFANLEMFVNNFVTTMTANFNTLSAAFVALQTDWANYQITVNQYIADHRVEMRYDPIPGFPSGHMVQWKYVFEADTEWRDLGVPIIVPYTGAASYRADIDTPLSLPDFIGDFELMRFEDEVSDPQDAFNDGYHFTAMENRDYRFVLSDLELIVEQEFFAGPAVAKMLFFWIRGIKNHVQVVEKQIALDMRDFLHLSTSGTFAAGTRIPLPNQVHVENMTIGQQFHFQSYLPGQVELGLTGGSASLVWSNSFKALTNFHFSIVRGINAGQPL